MDGDFDYDGYDEGEFFQGYEQSDIWTEEEEAGGVTVSELYSLCLLPSLSEGFMHVAYLLLWCFIFRITTQAVKIPVVACHAVSAASGLLVLNFFFGSTAHYILVLGVIFYLILLFTSFSLSKCVGVVTSVSCVVILILCEFLLVKKTEWHKIRGAQMIMVMKVISLAFDMEMGAQRNLPSPVEYAGYVFSVGTCVFGPWVPFRDYLAIYKKPVFNLQWLWKIILSLGMAFLFLTVSTCWVSWLIPEDAWRWWTAYRDAVSFRSSHYFVSFVSEASAIMSGYGLQEDLTWTTPVSRPHHIEIPRSLVQVVVYWSMPMHTFLKQYVFRTTRPFGNFVAIISTYAVSSLLHGLNLQLAAVLLSLGLYTYVEFMLRQKLASIFNACILSRPCRPNCPHANKETKVIVLMANIGFGLLTFFHLIYLGVMFDSTETQEEGYSYQHTVAKWSHLGYASHWVAVLTFVFHLLI